MPIDDEERGILLPEWNKSEPTLTFTKAQRKRNLYARKAPLRVMPDDKSQPVHRNPETDGSVLRVHPEGIEVGTSMGDGLSNYLGFGGIAVIIAASFPLYGIIPMFDTDMFWFFIFLPFPILFILVGVMFIRRAYFSPSDHPTLFNRKTREVHVIPVKSLSYFKFWEKGKPGKLRSYQWDHVTARTYRRLDVPGGTVARTETTLQLLCATPENPAVVDQIVSLGSAGTWSDSVQVALWEHIRRYMEEDGPPLQPGEKLREVDHTKLPEFPPDIVQAAGGPAMSEADLTKWTQAKA